MATIYYRAYNPDGSVFRAGSVPKNGVVSFDWDPVSPPDKLEKIVFYSGAGDTETVLGSVEPVDTTSGKVSVSAPEQSPEEEE